VHEAICTEPLRKSLSGEWAETRGVFEKVVAWIVLVCSLDWVSGQEVGEQRGTWESQHDLW
jgi:hypothetical protein